MHATHDLLSCASWPAEQFQAGKRSTFRTPSVLNPCVKEVFDAAFNCPSGVSNDKNRGTEVCSNIGQNFPFVVQSIPFIRL